jgi:hypothetical protein
LDGLAWLVTIFMLLFIMTEIIAANLFYTIKQLGGFFQVLSTLWSLIATRSSAYTAVNNYSTAESNIYLIVGIYVISVILAVIWIAVSIPLLNAASKNSSPGLLLPWLIYNVLITFVGIGLCIFLFVILFQQVHHIGIQILSIAASFLALGAYIEKLQNSRRKM